MLKIFSVLGKTKYKKKRWVNGYRCAGQFPLFLISQYLDNRLHLQRAKHRHAIFCSSCWSKRILMYNLERGLWGYVATLMLTQWDYQLAATHANHCRETYIYTHIVFLTQWRNIVNYIDLQPRADILTTSLLRRQ